MHIRAVILDVYGTLLELGPLPSDAAARWQRLWRQQLNAEARLDLAGFATACAEVIAREHATARARGVAHPEVFWPQVVAEVLPELAALSEAAREEFLFQQARLWHTVRLAADAAPALQALAQRGLQLGIASNAQPYTLRELREALAAAGLTPEVFTPSLCFWSFEHGFSKPDPHVFQLLTTRLAARGVAPAETLMVGDRLDHDIEPARAYGWQTWLLTPEGGAGNAGGWQALRRWLEALA
jgi:putative hydrolase of the HAD superfamily